jgi:hypothetical protein
MNICLNGLPSLGPRNPQFRPLALDAVVAAIQDPNPIAAGIARLIDGCAINFRAHVRRLGRISGQEPSSGSSPANFRIDNTTGVTASPPVCFQRGETAG